MSSNPNSSRGGSRGGANDYFVLEAEENVTKLEAAIQAAMERLRMAIERDVWIQARTKHDGGGSSTRNDHHNI